MDMQAEKPRARATVESPEPHQAGTRRKSLLITVIVLVALAALGWLAWYLTHQSAASGGPGARRGGPPPTTVGVATVQHADIPVELEALGTVTATATATVRPQVSGVLKEVLFNEGQIVKAGQLLAVIDPRPFENALMQATGQRQRDEAQLENARLVLERYRTLLAQDSIARQDVDTQAALVKQLQGTVLTDRAAESTARLNLAYSRVTAPIGGRAGLRAVDIGNLVSSNDANGLVVITQVSPIDVQFAVPQERIPELQARLREGATLQATAYDQTRQHILATGNFLALDNQVDTQTGTVRAKARFTNDKLSLFPSQFVNVRLLLRTIQDATVVPVSALRHSGTGDFVYVLNAAERTVSLRPVKRGQATVDKIEITSGLSVGEQVITEGADRLKDGASVNLPGDRPAPPGGGGRRQGGRGGAAAAAKSADSASGPARAPSGEGRRGTGVAQQ